MPMSRITTRFIRTLLTQRRYSPFRIDRPGCQYFSSISKKLESPSMTRDKAIFGQVSFLHQSALNSSAFQWLGFSSSASPEPNKKETSQSGNDWKNKADREGPASPADAPDQTQESVSDKKAEPGSDPDSEFVNSLSKDDLVKLVEQQEKLMGMKKEELEIMKDKVLRTYADMENVKDRTRRESENAKKFAIQNFAKRLLDVADNLSRASTAAKESFSKIDASKDAAGSVQQLKVLLEGVEMTEKQLAEVFKKFGLERYDPVNEEFDPNRHNAVFQVPDASKPAGHIAVVLKAGYMLHERIVRPAEVGVTVAVNNEEAEA